VAQAQGLVHPLVVELEGEHGRRREHLEPLDVHLDAPGLEARVDRLRGAGPDDALGLDDELGPQRVGDLVRDPVLVGIDDELHEAGLIAQVDEDQAAVVAAPGHPARERHPGTFVAGAQVASEVRAPAHRPSSPTSASSATRRCSPEPMSRTVASPAPHSSSPTMTTLPAPRREASSSVRFSRRPP
jgi:hypothetical protein